MTFKKKNLLGFVLVLMLLTVTSVVSANLIPTTAPCWVKGTVTSSDFTVNTLTVDAYLGNTLLKSSSVNGGVYDFNSLGANDGDTIDLKVDGATFDSFTFVGYCNTSGNPWVVENFSVSKQPNGNSCSSDDICTSGYCTGTVCAEPVDEGSSGSIRGLSNRSVANVWPVVNAQLPIVMNISDDKLGLVQISLMLGVTKEDVRIKISSLFDKPASIPKLTGNVYLYLEINKTNFENKDLSKSATIRFKVKKSWLKENGLSAEDIALYRFTERWVELNTKILSEDDEYVYFEAETPGFSYFAIVANKPVNAAAKEMTNNSSDLNDNGAATNKSSSNNQKTDDGVQTIKTNRNMSPTIIIVVLVLFGLVAIYLFDKSKKSKQSRNNIRSTTHGEFKKNTGSKRHVRKVKSKK